MLCHYCVGDGGGDVVTYSSIVGEESNVGDANAVGIDDGGDGNGDLRSVMSCAGVQVHTILMM